MNLSPSAYIVLTPEMEMQALPSGIYDPLLSGNAGLLLGRISATMAGLMIASGVIDADYTEEIKIMTSSPTHISVNPPEERIAQLVLIPLGMTKKKKKKKKKKK
jgi:dUTPase